MRELNAKVYYFPFQLNIGTAPQKLRKFKDFEAVSKVSIFSSTSLNMINLTY